MKTKSKFIKYLGEMGNLGLLDYEEYTKIEQRIKNNPHLR